MVKCVVGDNAIQRQNIVSISGTGNIYYFIFTISYLLFHIYYLLFGKNDSCAEKNYLKSEKIVALEREG
jgi:hypothetical protein